MMMKVPIPTPAILPDDVWDVAIEMSERRVMREESFMAINEETTTK
jgi:hypothetical protein